MLKLANILLDKELFINHFCTPTTLQNLRQVPIEVLRMVLQEIHGMTSCPVFASPRLWTPSGSEKCVVASGELSRDGKTRGLRFGLCVDTTKNETDNAKALYLWASGSLLKKQINEGVCSKKFQNYWERWRESSEPCPDKYWRLSLPLAQLKDEKWDINLDHTDGELTKFFRSLSGNYEPSQNVLDLLAPSLALFEHSTDAITPLIIDFYRHPDESASDTDTDLGEKQKNITRKLARNERSVQLLDESTSKVHRKVTIHKYEASELFRSEESVPPAKILPFMNTVFRPINSNSMDLRAAGLYGIFFKTDTVNEPSLIYVGLYRNGKIGSGEVFGGNVLLDRWVKHIATCSMRGANMGIGKRTAQLMRLLETGHPFHSLGDPDVAELIVRDRGCNAGENRVLFAKEHWPKLENASREELLTLFNLRIA